MLRHLRFVHGKEMKYRCLTCDKSYEVRSSLLRHAAWAESGKKHRCKRSICPDMFATCEERRKHELEVHGYLVCPFCDKEFANHDLMLRHKRKLHAEKMAEDGPFLCPICQAEFPSKIKQVRHEKVCRVKVNEAVRTHENKPRPVDDKPKVVKKPKPLDAAAREKFRLYQKKYNERQKQLVLERRCTVCKYDCKSVFERDEHERESHVGSGGSMVHKCSYCPEKFDRLSVYKKHFKGHPEVGSIPCNLCPKSFWSPASLRTHMEVEHTNKRYVCEQCGESFLKSYQLMDHEGVHTGKLRHECEYCGKSFLKYMSIYEHKKYYCPKAPYELKKRPMKTKKELLVRSDVIN